MSGPTTNSTLILKDVSTGVPSGTSNIICLQKRKDPTFLCTVTDTKPDFWSIKWLSRDVEFEGHTRIQTPSTSGFVNVSSRFTFLHSLGEDVRKNLTCMATSLKNNSLHITVQLQYCSGLFSDPSIDIQDLITGEHLGNGSVSTCIQSGMNRVFGCTLQQAEPDRWRITWVINDNKEINGSVAETPSTDADLVDLFSRFTLPSQQSGDAIKSLNCKANGPKPEISTTVRFQSCIEKDSSITIDIMVLAGVVSAFGAVLVATLVVLGVFVVRYRKSHNVPPTTTSPHDVEEPAIEMERTSLHLESDSSTTQEPVNYQNNQAQQHLELERNQDPVLPLWAERWIIPRDDFIVDERILGSGNFGEVRSGSIKIDGELSRAAIKMLKGRASRIDRGDFMDEFWTMASVGYHPNVVLLLGACQQGDVLYVALEYLPHGDLRNYLRTARSQSDSDEDALSSEQLVKFALDVACGMEHLSDAGIIHRDLAARNILVGEGMVAKVSDFGLSRVDDIYVQTSRRRVPLRWLAIESVKHQLYTTQSDVWSFGILLWEIVTFGGTPYPTIQNEFLADMLKRGYRMSKPDNCHDYVYALMRDCWEEDPNARPTFRDLVEILSDMADNRIRHTYMEPLRKEYQNMSAILPELDGN